MIITEEKRNIVFSYFVHAWELLLQNNSISNKKYTYWYFPLWSELYTGTLYAAGYLFLDNTIETFIFIKQQNKEPDNIVIYGKQKIFLIWWRKINNIWYNEKNKKNISYDLENQLLYARVRWKIKSALFLWVGTNVSEKEIIEKIYTYKNKKTWIIVLSDPKWDLETEKINQDDKKIKSILSKKIYTNNQKRSWNLYTAIVNNKKPELLTYFNTKEITNKKEKWIWYIVMVA